MKRLRISLRSVLVIVTILAFFFAGTGAYFRALHKAELKARLALIQRRRDLIANSLLRQSAENPEKAHEYMAQLKLVDEDFHVALQWLRNGE